MSMFQFVRIAVNLLQIMAGDDSPTEKKEEFHFGRSTPPPTTSYVVSKPDQTEIKSVAEPPKEDKDKDKDKDRDKDDNKEETDVLKSDSHPARNNPDEIRNRDDGGDQGRREKRDDNRDRDRNGGGGGGGDDKGDRPKNVDGTDALDGQWIPVKDHKQQYPEEEEDDNCTVKCLYYTMQCCECSIS